MDFGGVYSRDHSTSQGDDALRAVLQGGCSWDGLQGGDRLCDEFVFRFVFSSLFFLFFSGESSSLTLFTISFLGSLKCY